MRSTSQFEQTVLIGHDREILHHDFEPSFPQRHIVVGSQRMHPQIPKVILEQAT